MATKNFQLMKGVGACAIILGKTNYPPLSLMGDQRILVIVQRCGCVEWRLKFFNHHLKVGVCWMAPIVFWSPFDTPPLSSGEDFFLSPKKAWEEGYEMTIKTRGIFCETKEREGKKGQKKNRGKGGW